MWGWRLELQTRDRRMDAKTRIQEDLGQDGTAQGVMVKSFAWWEALREPESRIDINIGR